MAARRASQQVEVTMERNIKTALRRAKQQIDRSRAEGVVEIGHPLLRQLASEVSYSTAVRALAEKMIRLQDKLNAQGLAAPQLGISARIIVVRTRKNPLRPGASESSQYVMINPVIEHRFGLVIRDYEGCFSIPGYVGLNIPRFEAVEVSYLDINGNQRRETFQGLSARAVQHECGHLDGETYLGSIDPAELATVENFVRYHLPSLIRSRSS